MIKVQVVNQGITEVKVDVIVNAANEKLSWGGGVCGAIFRDCGDSKLQKECDKIGYCPTGSAVITNCYSVNAKKIIHAVGPIYKDHTSDDQLYNAYYNSLILANDNELSSIAFPSISTGIYGFPIRRASKIALKAVYDFEMKYSNSCIKDVYFTVIDNDTQYCFEKAVKEYKYAYSTIQELLDNMQIGYELSDSIFLELPFYYMFLNNEISKEDLLDRISYFKNIARYENKEDYNFIRFVKNQVNQIESRVKEVKERDTHGNIDFQKESGIWYYWATKISFWQGGDPDFDSMPENFKIFYFGKPPAYSEYLNLSFLNKEVYDNVKYKEYLKSEDAKFIPTYYDGMYGKVTPAYCESCIFNKEGFCYCYNLERSAVLAKVGIEALNKCEYHVSE